MRVEGVATRPCGTTREERVLEANSRKHALLVETPRPVKIADVELDAGAWLQSFRDHLEIIPVQVSQLSQSPLLYFAYTKDIHYKRLLKDPNSKFYSSVLAYEYI